MANRSKRQLAILKYEEEEWDKCQNDIYYFATNYCYSARSVKDAYGREEIKIELFPKYPYLKDLLKSFSETGNTVDAKSRHVLYSWSSTVDSLWNLIFTDNYSEKVISRKQDLVDDGGKAATPFDSLFGRVKFMWGNLPSFLKPELEIASLKIVNRENNSYIKGESSNSNATRGGTYSKIKIDECAFIENSYSIFEAAKGACPGNIKIGSTPHGRGNIFAKLWFEKDNGFKKNTWHWSKNPDYSQEWYSNVIKGLSNTQIASNYEIDFTESVAGRIYGDFDPLKQVKKIPYDKDLPLYLAIDPGLAGTALLWIQYNKINGEIYIIDEHQSENQGISPYVELIKKKFDLSLYAGFISDPAARSRSQGKTVPDSTYFIFLNNGIRLSFPFTNHYPERISTTKEIISKVYVDEKCTIFLDAISNYNFKTNSLGSVVNEEPEETEYKHIMSAFEYFCLKICPIRKKGEWRNLNG